MTPGPARPFMAHLKSVRLAKKISQAHVAAVVGVSVRTLRRLEKGDDPDPTLETVRRYCWAVGVAHTWTVELDPQPEGGDG